MLWGQHSSWEDKGKGRGGSRTQRKLQNLWRVNTQGDGSLFISTEQEQFQNTWNTCRSFCCTICFVQLYSHTNHLYSLWVNPLGKSYRACLNLLKLSQFIKSPYPVSSPFCTCWCREKNGSDCKKVSLISVPPTAISGSHEYWICCYVLCTFIATCKILHQRSTSFQRPFVRRLRRGADTVYSQSKENKDINKNSIHENSQLLSHYLEQRVGIARLTSQHWQASTA